MYKLIGNVGFVMLLIGVSAMDSESLLIPTAMTMIGMAMVFIYTWSGEWKNE